MLSVGLIVYGRCRHGSRVSVSKIFKGGDALCPGGISLHRFGNNLSLNRDIPVQPYRIGSKHKK